MIRNILFLISCYFRERRTKNTIKKINKAIGKIDKSIFEIELTLLILQTKGTYTENDIKTEIAFSNLLQRLIKAKEILKIYENKIYYLGTTS